MHAHIIDLRFPFASGPGYRPRADEAGSAADFAAVTEAAGIGRALLVQPSGYGTDNAAMLDAIAQSGGRWRGIAVVAPDVAESELDRLESGGVVGVRLNLVNSDALFGGPDGLRRLVRRVDVRGWLVQVQCPASQLPGILPALPSDRLVLDHFGYPDPAAGTEDPGFQSVLRLGQESRAFVKFSGAFRLSRAPFPWPDMAPLAAALLDAFGPERIVWGSDWPFVGTASPPSYAETLAALDTWVSDPAARRIVLAETPGRLLSGT